MCISEALAFTTVPYEWLKSFDILHLLTNLFQL